MFNRQSIHIAMLLWGCIFCLIAALCMFMSKNFDREKRKRLLRMQICTAVLLGSDALAWRFRGYPGMTGYFMVRISNFIVFLLSDLGLFLFHSYVCCYLFAEKEEEKHSIVRVKSAYWIAVAGMALVVLSQFTNLYYSFDEHNFYHRNPAYIISMLLPLCIMLIDLSLLIQYRNNLSRLMLVAMISYIALPLVAVVIQVFYYGISLINIGACISIILMFVVSMVEQNENLAKKENEAAELRISLLLSQIAPHFLYNTLTTIQRLCIKDPKMAQETVGDFAVYLRGNLDSLNQKEPIPFEKELEHVRCYLAIEKQRFGERVNVRYELEDVNFVIPALTLQPIVENAVKHGICRKAQGGTVTIRTEHKKENVYVIVKDDGVGFDEATVKKDGKNHVGIRNVRSRLRTMCSGTLEIQSKLGEGTMVVITLPQKGRWNEDYCSG
ncbi:MAG: histidine kinase [Lachnospiraceae bacterium]|nr:histidine kinase [Lachnospiraceae bacterium]